MKPGVITQYAHLSEFKTIEQFNETMKQALAKYGHKLTKGERLAFQILTRYCVKEIGICNARICKLVEAAQKEKGGISRSTFERMLRKIKQLGILTIHHTTRKKGGYSHSVYVFHRIDGTSSEKLTERQTSKEPIAATVQPSKEHGKTNKFEIKQKDKDLRRISLDSLDYTYVPSYVPFEFTKTVRPFFDRAKEICQLWDRALIAYRSMKFDDPIEFFTPTIIKAFKETVYQYKRQKIKTEFNAYYYGTLTGLLIVEKRKVVI